QDTDISAQQSSQHHHYVSSEVGHYEPSKISSTQKSNPNHNDKKPRNEKFFLCDFCGIILKHKRCFDAHILTHMGERAFLCDICGKSFTTKFTLEKHAKSHSNIKSFSCELCEKSYYFRHSLDQHKLTHSKEVFPCSQCGKEFDYKASLQRHLESHTSKKFHDCHICKKEFRQKSNLVAHIKTHSGEKLFKCLQCDQLFTRKSSLTRHNKIHERGKLYTCRNCEKKFNGEGELMMHEKFQCGNYEMRTFRFRTDNDLVEHRGTLDREENPTNCAIDSVVSSDTLGLAFEQIMNDRMKMERMDQSEGCLRNMRQRPVMEDLVKPESGKENKKFYSRFYDERNLDAMGMPPCSSRMQTEPVHVAQQDSVTSIETRAILESQNTHDCDAEIKKKHTFDRTGEFEIDHNEYDSETSQCQEDESDTRFSE
ncbi:hypothetical protein QAD02_001386, partial [Eretmocerus hayati]